MIRFEDLLERVRAYTSDEEREFLRRAYVFSALEHKGQVRHSGEPYLVHPLEVASILADMRLDPGRHRRRAAARRRRGHADHHREDSGALRPRGRPRRRRRDEDRRHSVLVERGAAGRELPQDAARDGRRHPRHPGEARRPPPQHAHALAHAGRPAAAHRAGDARHLRADREPARA